MYVAASKWLRMADELDVPGYVSVVTAASEDLAECDVELRRLEVY